MGLLFFGLIDWIRSRLSHVSFGECNSIKYAAPEGAKSDTYPPTVWI
jgi:hypothetical protein